MRSMVTAMLLLATAAAAAEHPPCDATVRFARTPFRVAFEGKGGGIFFEARLDGSGERRCFSFAPAPENFPPPPGPVSVPLEVEGRWSYIYAELKVAGRPPVTDRFLIDSGPADAVDPPIIKESTGPLRKTQTGVGIGQQVAGAIGP